MITVTLNPTCKSNDIMLLVHVLEQHHHVLDRHCTRTSMLTNSDGGFKICHCRELGSPSKKPKITYHQLKKVIRAKHKCIDMFFVEDKKQMTNAEDQQIPSLAHCAQIVLTINSHSNLHIRSHEADPFAIYIHKLTYHQLKNKICERQKMNYVSSVNHRFDKS
jgi:hypothetical protein